MVVLNVLNKTTDVNTFNNTIIMYKECQDPLKVRQVQDNGRDPILWLMGPGTTFRLPHVIQIFW